MGYLVPIGVGLLLCLGAVILVIWLRRRGSGPGSGAVRGVLGSQGAARCLAAVRALRDLERSGDESTIRQTWDVIELPLLQALPDCPPGSKTELIGTLDAIAKAVSTRELAKRIMTLRNSLL